MKTVKMKELDDSGYIFVYRKPFYLLYPEPTVMAILKDISEPRTYEYEVSLLTAFNSDVSVDVYETRKELLSSMEFRFHALSLGSENVLSIPVNCLPLILEQEKLAIKCALECNKALDALGQSIIN